MRSLEKNKQPAFALRFKGIEDIKDGDGNLTGEKQVTYYPAIFFKANISGAKGAMYVELFGTDTQYDKTIQMSKYDFDKLKFDDNTVFFINKKPEYKNGVPLYNYRILKIAPTLNEVIIAVKKADKQ